MSGRPEATEGVGRLAPAPRPVRLGALRHRDFRLFWVGQLISQIGTWMQSVAQAWLVLELTQSPLQLGLVSALQFTPILLLSPIGGVLSDRFAKRRVLLVSQTAMQLQAFVLAALVWSGRIQYWHVAVLALIYGLGRAIDIPARQSYITDLVGRSDLANAVALNSVVMNGARIVGPAVAGLLIAAFGVALAFFLNGVSFVAVLVALAAIRTEGRPDGAGRIGIMEGVLGALSYATTTPPVAFTLGLMVVVSLMVLNFNVVVPLVARDVLNQGAHGFGLLMSALGAGARRPHGAGAGRPLRSGRRGAGAPGMLSDSLHDRLQYHPAAHRAQPASRARDGTLHGDVRRDDALRLAAGRLRR